MMRWLISLTFLGLSACAPIQTKPSQPVAANSAEAVAPAATDASPIANSEHHYSLSWDGKLTGTATRQLHCEQLNCRYESHGEVPGLATLREVSELSWRNGRAYFQRYERAVQLLFFPQTVLIERDGADSIRTLRKGTERRYAASAEIVDLMSLELQVRADLLAGREPAAQYPVAQVKGEALVSLTRLPDETLQVAGREIATRVYENQDGDRRTTLWLDAQQQWLPVRIVHRDGLETYRMEWLGN